MLYGVIYSVSCSRKLNLTQTIRKNENAKINSYNKDKVYLDPQEPKIRADVRPVNDGAVFTHNRSSMSENQEVERAKSEGGRKSDVAYS